MPNTFYIFFFLNLYPRRSNSRKLHVGSQSTPPCLLSPCHHGNTYELAGHASSAVEPAYKTVDGDGSNNGMVAMTHKRIWSQTIKKEILVHKGKYKEKCSSVSILLPSPFALPSPASPLRRTKPRRSIAAHTRQGNSLEPGPGKQAFKQKNKQAGELTRRQAGWKGADRPHQPPPTNPQIYM